jgi:hypothetical protein
MSYLDIANLYKEQDILLFKECYALEKIHGTSAHVRFKGAIEIPSPPTVNFFSGGESHDKFVALFDQAALQAKFAEIFGPAMDQAVVVYGEAYGGKQQAMSATYGPNLKFIVFDVKVGDSWLSVPQAEDVAKKLGLEFVHYVRIPTTLEAIDAERDADSVQAVRNGTGPGHKREGVVLRPIVEVVKNNGSRIIAKHKRDEFSEHTKPPRVIDPAKIEVLKEAQAIADQWATEMRLTHVLQELVAEGKIPATPGMENTPVVIKAMIADIYKEGKGEVVESKEASTAIGKRTAEIWKKRVRSRLTGETGDKPAEGSAEAPAPPSQG